MIGDENDRTLLSREGSGHPQGGREIMAGAVRAPLLKSLQQRGDLGTVEDRLPETARIQDDILLAAEQFAQTAEFAVEGFPESRAEGAHGGRTIEHHDHPVHRFRAFPLRLGEDPGQEQHHEELQP